MTTTLHDQLRERVGLDALAEEDELAKRELREREHEDAPEGEDDRYAIYAVTTPKGLSHDGPGEHRRMATTSLGGIGLTLRTLREEDEYGPDDRIGILDRQERTWLVNPWARG